MPSFDEAKLTTTLRGTLATYNPSTGANKNADSLPTGLVYKISDGTTLAATVTVANITTGAYRFSVDVTTGNGFAEGEYYELWITAVVSGDTTVTQSAPITAFKATTSTVDDLPTNAELATALGTADDAVLAAIATVQSDTNDIQTRLPAALESGRIAAALDSASVTAVQTGLATSIALTAVGNNVTAILEDTGTTIPTQITALNNLSSAQVVSALGTGTWATALPWNAAWDAEVQSEVQDAIEVNNLDHLVKIAVDTNFATTVHLDSIIGHMSDNGTTATFSRSTDSLEAIRDNQTAGSGASLPDIIAGVQSVSGGIIAAQDEAALYITIGDTWTQDIDSLGDLTNKTLTFSIKTKLRDADTAAIVTIVEGTGLTRLNGAATTAGWGSITINDEVAGDITLRLESDATALLTSGTYIDAVKALEDGDDRTLRQRGRTVVSAGVIADIT
jgi:hypothetical protein